MKLSHLFTRTLKEAPSDETAINAQLLIRAGFIFKEMAGVYSFLPLGLSVIKKIEQIVREEMNAIGGTEMKTSVLQNKEVWKKSNRWDDTVVDNWFKTELKTGGEVGLSFTNEEAYANILTQYVSSYKDLPIYPYDFKEIFRNEVRSKSGILRGREFYWKALYSFSKNTSEHLEFHEKAAKAYTEIFRRVGIGDKTYLTYASGGTFSKFSHEFQALCDAGEDTIYLDRNKKIAINKEVFNDEVLAFLGLDKNNLEEVKAIEVGNIFTLGTKFSEPFRLTYKDQAGADIPVFMGSYGIGISRLMGTVVEVNHDEKGMIWPKSIAPAAAHLVSIGQNDRAQKVYQLLADSGIEVLYDDRDDKSAGEKFADADLIGCPVRLTIGGKTPDAQIEWRDRVTGDSALVSESELVSRLR